MSVSRTVSFPDELFVRLTQSAISPSKACQLGAEICLEGGVDVLKKHKSAIRDLRMTIDIRDIKVEEQQQKIGSLQEELAVSRQKMVEAIQAHEKCNPNAKDQQV